MNCSTATPDLDKIVSNLRTQGRYAGLTKDLIEYARHLEGELVVAQAAAAKALAVIEREALELREDDRDLGAVAG